MLSWRAHTRAVIAAEYLIGLSGFLTAGSDCTVRMWSLAGEQVGVFGQQSPWDLNSRDTWLDAESVEVGVLSRHKDLPSCSEVPLTDILPPPVLASLVATTSGRRSVLFKGQSVSCCASPRPYARPRLELLGESCGPPATTPLPSRSFTASSAPTPARPHAHAQTRTRAPSPRSSS
jgi:hypothetical protein